MTDLELIYQYIGSPFINPALFREIRGRGLYNIINFLPPNSKEAKAVVHARLAKNGKYIGNEEIQIIYQGGQSILQNAPYKMVEYLYSKHYDIFGLLDAWLAVE